MSRPLQIGDLVSITDADNSFLFPIIEIGNTILFSTPAGNGAIQITSPNSYMLAGWENHPHLIQFIPKELGGVVSLVPFDAQSLTNDFEPIKKFLQDSRVMGTVRDGKIWTDEKIRKYLSYFASPENSEFMDRKIMYSGQLVGIIGIRRDFELLGAQFLGWPFDWIVIDRRFWKKGIGKAALKLILQLYTTTYPQYPRVLSLISSNNTGSLKIHLDSGFAYYQETVLHDQPYRLLVYTRA